MPDLSNLTVDEMLNDRAESVLDKQTCRRLLALADDPDSLVTEMEKQGLRERIKGNQRIIDIIDEELAQRGLSILA